jgi:hypothetical protein
VLLKHNNAKHKKIVLIRAPMNELQVKLFDYLHKERKFKKRDAKMLCEDAAITSFEDWLVKFQRKGCPNLPQRCMGVSNLLEIEKTRTENADPYNPYDSDDDDCNDHFFSKTVFFFKN